MKDALGQWIRRRETQCGLAIAVALSLLYAMTMCRAVYWYDSAEFAAHAASLGVPHPPGYPLYTLIAHAFTWLPGDAAFSVNMMSAVFGVGTALVLYGLCIRLGASMPASTVGAMVLGTTSTFWANAVVAEVYTPGLLFTLGVFLLLERAQSRPNPWLVALAGLGGGLGLGMHMSIATCGLGYAWLVFTHGLDLERWRDFSRILTDRWRARLGLALGTVLAVVMGAAVFLYIPIRTFDQWDRREWMIFRLNATGGTFKNKFLRDYDVGARLDLTTDLFVNNLQYVGIAMAILGMVVLLRRRPRMGVALLLGAAGNIYWFFNYKVPDLDVFHLPALSIACLWIAFGIDGLGHRLARVRPVLLELQWLWLGLPIALTLRNYETVDLSQVTAPQRYAQEVCEGIEQPSQIILFSSSEEWQYYAVFLYARQALGACEGVEIWEWPATEAVHGALERDAPLYTFIEVPQLGRYHFIPEGRLFRVEKRRRKPRRFRRRRRRTTVDR